MFEKYADIRRSQMFEKYADIRRSQMFKKCADIRRSQMFESVPTFGEAKCLKKGSVPLRKNKPATMMVAGLEVCQSVNAYFFGKMIW